MRALQHTGSKITTCWEKGGKLEPNVCGGSPGRAQVSEAQEVSQQESVGNAGTLGFYADTQESDTT